MLHAVIGLFDSGLGGLSVLREVRTLLPRHELCYVADTANCPYGPRSEEFVRERSLAIGRDLQARGARLLVVPCNAASSAALEDLRAELRIPVVGMEPGVKPAVTLTATGVVGVLATARTAASTRLASLVQRFADGVEVLTQPCPGWVEQVERGKLDTEETRQLVELRVAPLLARRADVLVLGCTHYPFLRPLIEAAAGESIAIVDGGPAVARQVARRADECAVGEGSGVVSFETTGDPHAVEPVVRALLGDPTATVTRTTV